MERQLCSSLTHAGTKYPSGQDHAEATFWYVIPSLPMFLVLPWMLRGGIAFWAALTGACLLTVLLYGLTVLVAARFGVRL
jgi:hypothetical protein